MKLLDFVGNEKPKRKITFPLTILWPPETPAGAMPATWRQLPDGRLESVFQNVAELEETVWVLSMIKEATGLGGVVVVDQPGDRQAREVEQLAMFQTGNDQTNHYYE